MLWLTTDCQEAAKRRWQELWAVSSGEGSGEIPRTDVGAISALGRRCLTLGSTRCRRSRFDSSLAAWELTDWERLG